MFRARMRSGGEASFDEILSVGPTELLAGHMEVDRLVSVFTVEGGRIVRVRDYSSTDEALDALSDRGVRTDERTRMEAMHVYHLTIQENGYSRRFVYEERDEALSRFADAIAAGLDAKLDEVVRGSGTPSREEHTPMQALRIASYKVIKGTFPELADEAKRGMLNTFKTQPGFIRYGLADTGEGTCVSISLWETHAQAEAAAPVAATWVREHLADRVELRSTEVGDLAFFEGVP